MLVIAVVWMLTDRACLVLLERWTIERWGLVLAFAFLRHAGLPL